MIKLLSGIKAYWSLGVGFLLAGLAIAVKFLTARNSRLGRELDTLQARRNRDRVVAEEKEKNKQAFLSRSREIAKEIEEKKYTDELSRPNRKW